MTQGPLRSFPKGSVAVRAAAAALVAGAAILAAPALTAANSLAQSAAGFYSVTTSGAIAAGWGVTVSADASRVTGADVRLRGSQIGKTVTGTLGGVSVTCIVGVYDINSDTTTTTCSGFDQPTASTGWTLSVSVA